MIIIVTPLAISPNEIERPAKLAGVETSIDLVQEKELRLHGKTLGKF